MSDFRIRGAESLRRLYAEKKKNSFDRYKESFPNLGKKCLSTSVFKVLGAHLCKVCP